MTPILRSLLGDEDVPHVDDDPRGKMNRWSRRVVPPLQTPRGSADASGCVNGTMSASVETRGAISPLLGAQTCKSDVVLVAGN
jgi:hypothetical protein